MPLGKNSATLGLILACAVLNSYWVAAQTYEPVRAAPLPAQPSVDAQPGRTYKARINPHWLTNSARFWYRNDLRGGAKEFVLVDANAGTRRPAFDHQRLARALSNAAGSSFQPDSLPFSEISFDEGLNSIFFESTDKNWRCDLSSYQCTAVSTNSSSALPAAGQTNSAQPTQAEPQRRNRARRARGSPDSEVRSPDDKWTAYIRDHNVVIRSEPEGTEVELSHDGSETNSYSRIEWSPDSRYFASWRTEPGNIGLVYLIESSPPNGGRAIIHERHYAQAGDKFPKYELNLFSLEDHKAIRPELDRFEHEYETPDLHWMRDGKHVSWSQEDRGHQRYRVIKVDCQDGSIVNLFDEHARTFIWTAHTENLNLRLVNWLTNTDEFIYVSEMDGWRHLYLVGGNSGKPKPITHGEWVVRGIERIDEQARQIWFMAGGMNPNEDPYFIHYYRVSFDGSGLVAQTPGNGNHSAQFSPDRAFLVDTYSRVDTPPVHELRRTSDGQLVCMLEQADISELIETGWQAPEPFVAKGRDGKTDIWGVIYRPRDLDPGKKYPMIESIYNGPQGAYVPKSFSAANRSTNLTGAGFIVVQADAMGSAFRSKAFHDVCWQNLGDAGLPDRIAWIKAAAAKYPYMDVTRVGIFGTSAGGQNAAAAVLFHPEFYRCAVANSGCHDNRLDKASWNEQWMGYMAAPAIWSHDPENWYSKSSNIDNAAKLRGDLLLIVGEMDDNVPPESTMRFADALIKAKKDFDLLVIPGANHGAASGITPRRTTDFFVKHLLNQDPPHRNVDN